MKNFKQYYGSNISFIDMLFNIIIVFVLLFFVSIMMMNPVSKKSDIESKADLLIVMSWPDFSNHDIDLWVKPPEGPAVFYNHRENSFIFLDRDDLGISNNFVIKDGIKSPISPRREVITFRGKMPGRYVSNVHFYLAKDDDGKPATYDGTPIPIIVELIQINPVYKILTRKEISLNAVKQEKTAFSFIIRDDLVTEIDTETEEPFLLTAPKPPEGYHYQER